MIGLIINKYIYIRLQSTFLYVRIKKNPSRYMIEQDEFFDSHTLTPFQVLRGTKEQLVMNDESLQYHPLLLILLMIRFN